MKKTKTAQKLNSHPYSEESSPFPPQPTRLFRDSYERCLPAMLDLSPAELVRVNIDIPTAVTLALRATPKLIELRAEVNLVLTNFDMTQYASLEDITRALAHAHALYLNAKTPQDGLSELIAEALALRASLSHDAASLAKRGRLEESRLNQVGSSNGYRNIAFDLLALAELFHHQWHEISSRTSVEPSELQRAEEIANKILLTLGSRDSAVSNAEAANMRQRAFTLFVRAYSQVRRIITFIRWDNDDADSIAPSLYTGRRNRKKNAEPRTEETPDTLAPVLVFPGTPTEVPARDSQAVPITEATDAGSAPTPVANAPIAAKDENWE